MWYTGPIYLLAQPVIRQERRKKKWDQEQTGYGEQEETAKKERREKHQPEQRNYVGYLVTDYA